MPAVGSPGGPTNTWVITQYLWAHRDYQPWGQTLLLQCPQCRVINPWISAFVKHIQGYYTQSILVRARGEVGLDDRSVVVILPNPVVKKRDSTAD